MFYTMYAIGIITGDSKLCRPTKLLNQYQKYILLLRHGRNATIYYLCTRLNQSYLQPQKIFIMLHTDIILIETEFMFWDEVTFWSLGNVSVICRIYILMYYIGSEGYQAQG